MVQSAACIFSGRPKRIRSGGTAPAALAALAIWVKAWSTAMLDWELSRIRAAGLRRSSCKTISAMTAVLPVPGGPWMRNSSLLATALLTAVFLSSDSQSW